MGERKRILIVDDEHSIADMISDFCTSFGFDTKMLIHTEEISDILSVVKAYQPDLITLDLMMPEFSGLEILERLRNDPATKHIPVIVISVIAANESVTELLKDRAQGILPKPVQMKNLKQTIEQALSSSC